MIILGSDHAGFELKSEVINWLKDNNYDYLDIGTNNKESVDYPIYAQKLCDKVLEDKKNIGILICGTGIGISIKANRNKGIRCALCTDSFSAKATREHNNANVLALGGRVVGGGVAIEIVNTFLTTDFSNEAKHIRRIEQLD